MTLESQVKILWKPLDTTQNSQFTKDGWSLPERIGIAGVRKGGRIHEDLGNLARYLRTGSRKGKQWSVARIECYPEDYEPDTALGSGWYKARHNIISSTGFMPLNEAEKRYLHSKSKRQPPKLPYNVLKRDRSHACVIEKDGVVYLSCAEAKRRTMLTDAQLMKAIRWYADGEPFRNFYQAGRYSQFFVPLEMVKKVPTYTEPATKPST